MLKGLTIFYQIYPLFVGRTPLCSESLNLRFIEICERVDLVVCGKRGILVADNATGDDKTIFWIGLGERFDLPHDLHPQRRIRNLVESIQEQKEPEPDSWL